MSFETYEESIAGGSKVELYTITLGSVVYRMHSSSEVTITHAGDTYYRAKIHRGKITLDQEYLEVFLPGDHEFPLLFKDISPGKTAILTLYQFHRADPADVRFLYKGAIRSVAFSKDTAQASLSVVPISKAFNKLLPDRTFQSMCNNVLFDTKCQISAGAFVYTDTVIAVSSNVVTISGLESSKGDGWATGGYVCFGTLDYRLILEQDGNDLILVLPFHEDVLGEDVSVYAGCDHTIATCNSKFSNEINFGGCPYVPTKNIFVTGIR